MRIFSLGLTKEQLPLLRGVYPHSEIVEVNQYQDVLALCADVVILNTDNVSEEIVDTIKEYEKETADVDNTKYIYIRNS